MEAWTIDAVEDEVARHYQELLGLPEAFDRTESFVRLGGQSSAAAQMQIRLLQSFGVAVSFADMFKASDAVSLARLVHDRLGVQG